ncbi:MAG: hypothetical protein FK733_07755 [Asgard group archaeon]|nr:hypothetical protein [Asgard group archaeon]
MAAEAHWMFVTDKYSMVEIIDSAIVVTRFNQKDLLRDLIEIRCDLLQTKSYDDTIQILDQLLKINEKITDVRLSDVVGKLIDQLTLYKKSRDEYDKKVDNIETKATD